MRKLRVAPFAYYAFLAVVTAAALGPAIWVMLSSFRTSDQVFSGGSPIPNPPTLQGYIDAFTQVPLGQYLLNTATYAVGGSVGTVVLATLAAYPAARYDFPGKNLLTTAFTLALAVPIVALATPEFYVMRELHLFNTRIGMILFYSALYFPLSFVIMRAFLISLPVELEEAAIIDGAGYFRTLRSVVLPLARPAFATVGIIVFVGIWNEFFFANLLILSPELQNAQLALAAFRSQFGFNVTAMLAGTTVVMLVPIVIFLILQKQVIAGLTAGSVR